MRTPTVAAAGLVVMSALAAEQAPVSLLTLPQGDRLRSLATRPTAAISADGRYIAFASFERLSAEDIDARSDVYVLDRDAGTVTLQSGAVEGIALDSDCLQPRISGDGRFVVFESALLRPAAARVGADILLRDRVGGSIRVINPALGGGLSNGWSADSSIDAAGTIVVFASAASDLVPGGDANGLQSDVYAFRAATGALERVSVDSHGRQPSVGLSVAPSVSADGRFVAFTSTAPLDSRVEARAAPRPNTRPVSHVFVRDLQQRTTRRIAPAGSEPNGSSMNPSISGDGRYVAFVSQASNLVAGDRNHSADVFLFDSTTGAIVLVSRGPNGRPANGASGGPSISADGRIVAFHSDASDLTCMGRCRDTDDINLLPDVFVFDRGAGAITRVSTGSAGAWIEESVAPAVDATGEILAFTSKHPIDADDLDDDFDLFVRVPVHHR